MSLLVQRHAHDERLSAVGGWLHRGHQLDDYQLWPNRAAKDIKPCVGTNFNIQTCQKTFITVIVLDCVNLSTYVTRKNIATSGYQCTTSAKNYLYSEMLYGGISTHVRQLYKYLQIPISEVKALKYAAKAKDVQTKPLLPDVKQSSYEALMMYNCKRCKIICEEVDRYVHVDNSVTCHSFPHVKAIYGACQKIKPIMYMAYHSFLITTWWLIKSEDNGTLNTHRFFTEIGAENCVDIRFIREMYKSYLTTTRQIIEPRVTGMTTAYCNFSQTLAQKLKFLMHLLYIRIRTEFDNESLLWRTRLQQQIRRPAL
jgi:hypothetical protein